MRSSELFKRVLVYVTVAVTFIAAMAVAIKLKTAISNKPIVAALGPELSKAIGMLGGFLAYLAMLGTSALAAYPTMSHKTKPEIHEPSHKPVLSQQTPVPR